MSSGQVNKMLRHGEVQGGGGTPGASGPWGPWPVPLWGGWLLGHFSSFPSGGVEFLGRPLFGTFALGDPFGRLGF